jgi:hypothetical protein
MKQLIEYYLKSNEIRLDVVEKMPWRNKQYGLKKFSWYAMQGVHVRSGEPFQKADILCPCGMIQDLNMEVKQMQKHQEIKMSCLHCVHSETIKVTEDAAKDSKHV